MIRIPSGRWLGVLLLASAPVAMPAGGVFEGSVRAQLFGADFVGAAFPVDVNDDGIPEVRSQATASLTRAPSPSTRRRRVARARTSSTPSPPTAPATGKQPRLAPTLPWSLPRRPRCRIGSNSRSKASRFTDQQKGPPRESGGLFVFRLGCCQLPFCFSIHSDVSNPS